MSRGKGPLAMAAVTAAVIAGGTITAADGASDSASKLRKITYVYGRHVPLPPGQDTFARAVCPKGTLAVGGGFVSADEAKPEEEATNTDIVVFFAGINSTSGPPRFIPRAFEVGFRNTGTSTTTTGAARVTCVGAGKARLVIRR